MYFIILEIVRPTPVKSVGAVLDFAEANLDSIVLSKKPKVKWRMFARLPTKKQDRFYYDPP